MVNGRPRLVSNLKYAVMEIGDIVGRLKAAPASQRLQATGQCPRWQPRSLHSALRVVFDRIYASGLDSWGLRLERHLGLWRLTARRRSLALGKLGSPPRGRALGPHCKTPTRNRARVSQVATAFAELPAVIDCRAGRNLWNNRADEPVAE